MPVPGPGHRLPRHLLPAEVAGHDLPGAPRLGGTGLFLTRAGPLLYFSCFFFGWPVLCGSFLWLFVVFCVWGGVIQVTFLFLLGGPLPTRQPFKGQLFESWPVLEAVPSQPERTPGVPLVRMGGLLGCRFGSTTASLETWKSVLQQTQEMD